MNRRRFSSISGRRSPINIAEQTDDEIVISSCDENDDSSQQTSRKNAAATTTHVFSLPSTSSGLQLDAFHSVNRVSKVETNDSSDNADSDNEMECENDSSNDSSAILCDTNSDSNTEADVNANSKKRSHPHAPVSRKNKKKKSSENNESSENDSDEETDDDDSQRKNVNKKQFCGSTSAKFCHICKKDFVKRIVRHYKEHHKDSEVYASRFSPKSAAEVQNDTEAYVIRYNRNSYVRAKCYFCDAIIEHMPNYWKQHYTLHTGEFMFHCETCNEQQADHTHSHPVIKTVENHNFLNDLVAYICVKCNYVQLNENNVVAHLRNEHEIQEENVEEFYKEITLLPSKEQWLHEDRNIGNKNVQHLLFLFGEMLINILISDQTPPDSDAQSSSSESSPEQVPDSDIEIIPNNGEFLFVLLKEK